MQEFQSQQIDNEDRAFPVQELLGLNQSQQAAGLVATPEEPLQPRSVLAILDGLASIRWCYILAKNGTEKAVHAFFDWLVRLVRSRPAKTDQMAQFWMSTSSRRSRRARRF